MKIKLIIFTLLIFQLTYSQLNGTIKYTFSFEKIEDSKKTDKDKKDMMFALMEKTIQTLENAEFILKFNSDVSYYKSEVMSLDNTMNIAGKGTFKDYKEVFCEAKLSELYYFSNLFGKEHLVKYPKFNYTLYEEFKNINDIKTQKAIVIFNQKQYAEVWFSLEHKLPYGPSVFYGLPGIILETTIFVNETYKYTYKANSIKFNLDKIEVKEKPSNIKIKTDEEVQKTYKEARGNIGKSKF